MGAIGACASQKRQAELKDTTDLFWSKGISGFALHAARDTEDEQGNCRVYKGLKARVSSS
jgi:hypothetical protein